MGTETVTTTLTTEEAAAVGALAGGMFGALMMGVIVFYIFTVIACWKIFEKAGEKGWKSLIPIYNLYIMFKIVKMEMWFWITLAVSVISSIIMVVNNAPTYIVTSTEVVAYNYAANPIVIVAMVVELIIAIWAGILYSWRLAKAFGHGAGFFIGLILLPNIFWLILGFGKSKYNKKALK